MGHRSKTSLHCKHSYSVHGSKHDPNARKLTRYDECVKCGHRRRFSPASEVEGRCWERDVEVDGQAVTYRAHAASDPETVAMMDELVQAAYRHMVQTRKVQ